MPAHQPHTPPYKTQPEVAMPWYLLLVNLGLALPLLSVGVVAYLIRFGVLQMGSVALLASPPVLIAIISTIATVSLVVGIWRAYLARKEKEAALNNTRKLGMPPDAPEAELKYELARNYNRVSTSRFLTWDFALLLGIGMGANLGMILFAIISNTVFFPGATALIPMLSMNSLDMVIWAATGGAIGALIGGFYRHFAYWWVRKRVPNPEVQLIPMKATPAEQKELAQPVRYLTVASKHDLPSFVRIVAAAVLGLSIVSAVNVLRVFVFHATAFTPMVAGIVGLVFVGFALIGPKVFRQLNLRLRGLPDKKVQTEEDKEDQQRFWFEENHLVDFPWHIRGALAFMSGNSFGMLFSMVGGAYGGLIVAAVALLSPYIFRALKNPLRRLRAQPLEPLGAASAVFEPSQIMEINGQRYKKVPYVLIEGQPYKPSIWNPTPHGQSTYAGTWFVRTFAGGTSALLGGTAMGALFHMSALIPGGIIFGLILIAPLYFAGLRRIRASAKEGSRTYRFMNFITTPQYTTDKISPLPYAYVQGYVRLVIGLLVGNVLGMAIMGLGASPIIVPLLTLGVGLFSLLFPPLYKMLVPQKSSPELERTPEEADREAKAKGTTIALEGGRLAFNPLAAGDNAGFSPASATGLPHTPTGLGAAAASGSRLRRHGASASSRGGAAYAGMWCGGGKKGTVPSASAAAYGGAVATLPPIPSGGDRRLAFGVYGQFNGRSGR